MANQTPDNTGKGSNPRDLGINAIGPSQFADSYETSDGAKVTKIHGNPNFTAQEFYDNKAAADAARRKLIADQAEARGPQYNDQFMPPADREESPPPPLPPAPSEMITELPDGFTTPPTGNLRAVNDMVEVPAHLKPVQPVVESTPAPELITGVPTELQTPPVGPSNPTPSQ